MIDLIGWLGMLCLAWCGVPQIVKLVRTRSADGLSLFFLASWAAGELGLLIYVIGNGSGVMLVIHYIWGLLVALAILLLAVAWRGDRA